MIVADIMTHPALAIGPEAPLLQAIRLMTGHRVSGLPVVGPEGQILGVLTEGDLLRRAETGTAGDQPGWLAGILRPGRTAQQYVATHGRRVGDVMTTEVIAVTEDTSLADAVDLMQRHRVRRLPVLRDGKLLGVVSRADLVRHLGEVLAAEAPSTDDGALQQAVLDAIERQPWARGHAVSVVAKSGVVQLDGCVFDLNAREGLGVLADNVPGVRQVENRIVCIEPYSGTVTYDPAA